MCNAISAIIPTYNRNRFLQEAVSALQRQTRPLQQIILWDDGSTDGTHQVAQDLKAQDLDDKLHYFRAENQGKSASLNAAMKHATGDYLWICDDDDIACPDAAERMAGVLDRGDAGLVGGKHVRFSLEPASGEKQFDGTGYWPDLASGSVIRHMLEDIFFFQNASLVRRSCFETVGTFREDLARSIDYEMFVRLGTRFPIAMVDGIIFEQRKHDGARGPAAQSHAAAQSEAVWLLNDRAIFAELRERLPINFYEAFFEASTQEVGLRAAYLQRACVYARRTDWTAALDDFETAAAILPQEPLTETESEIVVRAMAGKHGNKDAYSSPTRDKFMALKALNRTGRSIVAALGRGSLWRARKALQEGDIRSAARISRFSAQACLGSNREYSSVRIHEKKNLAPEAYAW